MKHKLCTFVLNFQSQTNQAIKFPAKLAILVPYKNCLMIVLLTLHFLLLKNRPHLLYLDRFFLKKRTVSSGPGLQVIRSRTGEIYFFHPYLNGSHHPANSRRHWLNRVDTPRRYQPASRQYCRSKKSSEGPLTFKRSTLYPSHLRKCPAEC